MKLTTSIIGQFTEAWIPGYSYSLSTEPWQNVLSAHSMTSFSNSHTCHCQRMLFLYIKPENKFREVGGVGRQTLPKGSSTSIVT